jgi:hypothetical protein
MLYNTRQEGPFMVAHKWDKEKFISGIYNYCDRWCERCPMTDHCFLFYQESIRRTQHENEGEDPDDMSIILQDVNHSLNETIDALQKKAAETGLDLTESTREAEKLSLQKREKRLAHPFHVKAHHFANAIHKFLEILAGEIHSEKRRGTTPEDLAEIQNCFEILSWYHMQIAVKIDRALQSRDDEREIEVVVKDGTPRDSDGSAKVAHIGMIKLVDAMMKIHEWNSSWNTDLIPLLNELYELIEDLDREFPGHKKFKRPGFDE